ncbi:MAG: hypothetical protein CMP91_12395 [Gammaproteobacteria bacterium]|nr:hypothetical protein [Gammaproteobacteria bacterium]|tara:strand:- start:381 stop:602 length:222 start_codon:yes stop_codon:yes gene_type:complete
MKYLVTGAAGFIGSFVAGRLYQAVMKNAMQPGDVKHTYADTSDLESYIGYKPATPLKTGIDALVKRRRSYLNL